MNKIKWWKILKDILKAGSSPETKFFKAWFEEDPDKKDEKIGCLFAKDGRRALLVKRHGLFITEPGIYTLFDNDIILCGDKEAVLKVENFRIENLFNLDAPKTILHHVDVPRVKGIGRETTYISLPNDSGEDFWTIGIRDGHTTMNMDFIPTIRKWDSIEYEDNGKAGRILFQTIEDDLAEVSYLVMGVSHA
ncbi:MAG: hypothetical protein HQM09_15120 [Candidatus Riflebacteria bacterium]|nr:hypothetical protein [Candidatus Riflebacteria bacterium]